MVVLREPASQTTAPPSSWFSTPSPMSDPDGPLAPRITSTSPCLTAAVSIKFSTSSRVVRGVEVRSSKIGTNRFVGDLHRYHITATIEEISVDIELTGKVRAGALTRPPLFWRQTARKALPGSPTVPNGLASVSYRIGNQEHRASGSGYHDHNWGDVPMQGALMHNWYWARASIGPYHRFPHHRRPSVRP